MKRIETTRFGTIEIDESNLVTFPRGLLGFSRVKEYCLVDHDKNGTLRWLQASGIPELAFLVAEPRVFFTDYEFVIREDYFPIIDLKQEDHETLVTLVILSVHEGGKRITANLQAPIVFNGRNKRAVQVICDEPHLQAQHQVYPLPGQEQSLPERAPREAVEHP
ncbi:MAG: hypothetical protein A2284_08240 [Deltaproteobacteria bacterium RIFOXYA12_FULL_61_11]|nr:MAG: hypothetical protein A2284_08240 [Deltaproteobacteria bacterium RIFOXYA12_FULL_61_11]